MKELMELFEDYRLKAGLSMTKLSKLAGINVAFYCRLNQGDYESIGVKKAGKIAHVLEIPSDEFLSAIGFYKVIR